MSRSTKSSMFVKIFIPIICIMLIQTGIINVFLFASGTTDALNYNSIDILSKNVQNRGSHLEHLMVHYWSNVDRLEFEVIEGIRAYLEEYGLTIADVLGNRELEIAVLDNMSGKLIDALRGTSATGVFMYFLSGEGLIEEVQHLNGLYYRDLSLLTNIHANLMFVRGHVDIARKDSIPLDSLWNEFFTFDPQHQEMWRSFAYPQIAAAQLPNASSVDLSFWNRPHFLNADSVVDANEQITYTRPIIIGGQVIAMIGTEMQLSHMERHFPARDLDNFSEGGYMLVRYCMYQAAESCSYGDIFRVTGAFMNRLLSGVQGVTLRETHRDGVHIIAELPEVHVVYYSMRLYNQSSAFFNQQWLLAAIATERALFEMTRTVNNMILMGSALACLLGGVFLYFTVRSFTKPIESIIGQLKGSDGNTIVAQKATAYEIDMLCYTINDMTERRLFAERQIREERQRYMLALESSSDTFLEYDAVGDALSIYYFTQRLQQSPEHRTIPNFMRLVANQEFFHPDDNYNLFNDKNHEVRVKTTFFSHIQDSDAENGYFWLSIKTITIYDNEGRPEKVIGTAREITREKAKEFAAIETSRRDLTTGFLNITHGLELVQQSIKAAFDGQKPFVMSLVCINNFDRLEVTYGRIFGGIFMAEFSNVISRIIGTQGFVVRMGNDEFLIYHELTWEEAQAKDDLIQEAFDALYTGEETDFELSLSIEPVEGDYKFADAKSDKPVNVSFDPNDKEGLGNLVLELFERTSHIGSSVRMLLRLVGRLFALDSIVVCTYDPSFGTNQVAHQWHTEDGKVYSSDIKKVSQAGFDSLMYLLNEDDVMIYASAEVVEDPINALLCISPGESVSIYCCAGHEHAVIVGSMLFISGNSSRVWVDKEQDILQNIAKIIATYMNVEKSRSASRAKSRFLSRVSHEIRTPMNAIIGMTNIAMEATKTDNHARLDDCLNKINVAARYLLSLINDVLEMARIESGKLLQIENRSFSMRSFVQDIEAVIRFAIESNGIEFRVVSTFNHDRIISDEYRLKQVIINLLGNANKFTRPGGVITLSIEYIGTAVSEGGTQQARVRFSVKDNGIGIPFGKQASIFKPFEQADTPSLNNQQGTGLGLSISANIITALGSTIELESEPGKGSEFSFVLDLLLDEAVAVATGLSEPDEYAYPPDHFKGKRVLLVDDVDINIEIVEFILDGVGFTVETATNGKEAVDKFFAAPQGYYDVILMDIQMPVMDGITAARAIRGNYERPDAQTIPIIALTANAFDEDLKKSVESGMDNHITKPVNEKELLALLKRKL